MANKPLTQDQLDKVEEKLKIYMANKQSWVKRYGKDAENVMRGRAISTVKKETENMNKQKLKELVKTSLMKEVSNSEIELSVKNMISNSEYDMDDFKISSDNPNKIELRYQYYSRLPEDLRSSLENEFDVVENELEDEDTLPQYSYIISSKMNEAKKKSFPDLTGDGKVTRADILKGRGVELDEALSSEQKMVETFLKRIAKEFDYSIQDAARFVKDTINKMDLKESSVNEDIDLGHEDNEPHMIKGELYRIGKYAMELYQIVDGFEGQGEVDFPAWWQSKITTSMNNMVSAKHYLDFELKEPAIDAMVGVASDEEIIDENIDKADILSGELYKLKGKIQDAFFDKIRFWINMGNYQEAEELINRVKGQMKEKGLDEKKLTSAEKKKKEEIVKGMKDSFKGDKEAMYAIATDKAKKVAETIAKKLKENVGLKKGDTVEYEGNKYKIGSFDIEANLVYLNTMNGKPAEDRKGDYLKVNATRVKKTK